MLKMIEQWLLPSICCLCEKRIIESSGFCSVCKASLPWIEDRCYRCGLQLTNGIDSINCQHCSDSPPKFDRLCALFDYQAPIIKLIMGLKFGEQLAYGKILGELLFDAVHRGWYKNLPIPEAILPVPLHPHRLRKRGYNQSLELLGAIQRKTAIPILNNACSRIRNTRTQLQLKKTCRKQNVNHAFRVNAPIPFSHIAVIDDVVTTASTVNAISEVLKRNGIEQIDIWCICRA